MDYVDDQSLSSPGNDEIASTVSTADTEWKLAMSFQSVDTSALLDMSALTTSFQTVDDDDAQAPSSTENVEIWASPEDRSKSNHSTNQDYMSPSSISSSSQQTTSFFDLFSYADRLDVMMMVLGTCGAVVHGTAMPVYFHLLSSFMNVFGGETENSSQTASKYSLYLVSLGIIMWVAAWTEVFCWTFTGERQAVVISYKYLEALLRQDIAKFDNGLQTGELIESISSDVILIQNAIGEKMGNAIHFMATLFAGLIIGFATVWQMALVTIGVVPLIATAAGLQAYMITNISSKSQEAYGKAGAIAEQAIAQVRTVYAFAAESKTIQTYNMALINARKLGYKIGLINGLGLGTMFATTYGSFCLLIWFGSVAVIHGFAKGADALITTFVVILGGIALGQASLSLSAFAQARGAAMKIFKTIKQTSNMEKDSQPNKYNNIKLQGQIEFRAVDFFYPSRPNVPVLKNFSLTVLKGRSVAIVGSSGSGKSTLIALLERFYNPTAGCILLDGYNIRTFPLKWLRQQLALVSQEPALFATSIKENILLGNENATEEEVESAAKFSQAHGFIENFPDGYDTQVGDKGVQLSGGQKQRIAIARAILKNPSVLLLDEATSALDSSSEKLVQDALDQFMVGRTTIVIAHRLSTIQHVDTIVVMNKGVLVESGTHQELMWKRHKGAYYKLVKLQEISHATATENVFAQGHSVRLTPRMTFMSTPRRSLSSPYISPGWGALSLTSELSQSMSTYVASEGNGYRKEREPIEVTDDAYFRRLLKINAPEWPHAIFAIFGSILTGIVTPFGALILAAVAGLYYTPDRHYLREQVRLYTIYFVIISSVGMIGHVMQEYFWGYVNENLTKRIREQMLSTILKNEVSWFDKDENSSSHLSARLALDAATIRTTLGTRVSLILNNLTVLTVGCIISFILSWKMSLVTLAVFPLAVLAAVAEKYFLKGYTGDIELAHRKASKIAGEAIANIRTITAFCAEEKILSLFLAELKHSEKKSLVRGQVSGFMFGSAKFVQFSSYALSLWYGLLLMRHSEASSGDVFKVFFVLLVGAMVVGDAIGIVPDLVRGGNALGTVFSILDRKTQIDPDDRHAHCVDGMKGDIELKKVDFSYPSRLEVPVLKELSLTVPAGTSLALVGPSGCGKSTVVALIERFYDPVSGKVMVDGVDIRTYNLKSLRMHIGLVQQEPVLFATTIYDNILYGNAEATQVEVVAAAKAANAHDFVSALPQGYQTFVGERGVQLSGGQKQRVAIARAMVKNPTILLLDEATSALDTKAEKVVQDAIERLMKGRTVVVVAHRLSTIRNVDSIAVLQNGRVIEQGNHTQLLSKPLGAYSRLVALQSQQASSA